MNYEELIESYEDAFLDYHIACDYGTREDVEKAYKHWQGMKVELLNALQNGRSC